MSKPRKGFLPRLKKLILEEAKDSKPAFPIRPSAAGSCSRKLAYDYSNYKGYTKIPPKELEAREHLLFQLGHKIEQHVIDLFKRGEKYTKYRVDYEQHAINILELPDGEKLTGHIDFALIGKDDAKIVDVKSAKDRYDVSYQSKWDSLIGKFKKLKSISQVGKSEDVWYISDLPKFLEELYDPFFQNNFLQLNLYCTSDWAKGMRVTHGIIFRYNKNDSRTLEIWFEPSDKLRDKILDQFCKVVKTVSKTKNPESVDRDFVLGDVRCAYCPYRHVCWPDKDAEAEFLKKFEDKSPLVDHNHPIVGRYIEQLEELWDKQVDFEKEKDQLIQRFVAWMLKTGYRRLKTKSGRVFVLKYYKCPSPRYTLVEGKRLDKKK